MYINKLELPGKQDISEVIDLWFNSTCFGQPFVDVSYWVKLKPVIYKHLESPSSNTFICRSSDELVGFITLFGSEIAGLFVHPQMMSSGIGTSLLQYADNRKHLESVKVYAANNAAISFYRKHGFDEAGRLFQPETDQHLITMNRSVRTIDETSK